jgi:hypothetical protein
MIKIELKKDWEVMRERVILKGSFVMVPYHTAEQLKAAGFIVSDEDDAKPEIKTPKTK